MDIGIEDEAENVTGDRKDICSGTSIMATHAYTKNPESPLEKEQEICVKIHEPLGSSDHN